MRMSGESTSLFERAVLEANRADATEIILWGCGLASLPEEQPVGMDRIRDLSLHDNHLRRLPPWVFSLPRLETLILNDNEIEEIAIRGTSGENLRYVGLARNKLSMVPDGIFVCSLEELDLGGNKLAALPTAIGACEMLVSFEVGGNLLRNLPPEVGRCVQLEYLGIAGNPIGELPMELCGLPRLEQLWVDLPDPSLTRIAASGSAPEILKKIFGKQNYEVRNLSARSNDSIPPDLRLVARARTRGGSYANQELIDLLFELRRKHRFFIADASSNSLRIQTELKGRALEALIEKLARLCPDLLEEPRVMIEEAPEHASQLAGVQNPSPLGLLTKLIQAQSELMLRWK